MLSFLNKESIAVLGGAALVVGGIILSKKANMKCKEIMKEREDSIGIVNACLEDMPEEYSEEDKVKDMQVLNIQTAIKLIKATIAPCLMVIVGAFGFISTFIKSYTIMMREEI